MPTPSIVIVPARLKAATLFSQLPLTGEADLSLVQASGNATRVNASGLIEVPRTNLLLRSEEFNDAYWSKTQQGTGLNPVVTPNNAISPDGNQTADLVVFNRGAGNSSNDRSILSSTSTIVSGSQYNGSVWVKAATPSDIGKQIAFRHVAQATHLVITLTDNWVRYNKTESSVLTAGDWRLVSIGTVTADNVVGVHVWGAQLEIGNTATTYIPTTSSIRTLFAGVAQDGALSPNVPRLDYRNLVGAVDCPALLVEPSATNLCRYSEQFNTVTSGWIPDGLQTITGNTTATLDPAGGNTADLIVATTGTINHDIRPSSDNLPAFVSGTTYTYSVFAKATSVTSGFVQIYLGAIGFSPASPFANFQLSGNGAITTGNYLAASIQPFGNGWYRCSITATAAANGNAAAPIQPILTSGVIRNGTFAGNGIDGVYLWGAQLEVGSVATSYIPTTTASATRGADNYSVSGAVSGFIGLSSGAIYAEVDVRNWEASGRVVALSDGTSDGSIVIMENANRSFSLIVNVAGSSEVNITTASGLYNGLHRIAIAYKKDDYAVYLNGQLAGTDTSAGVPSVNRIFVGKIESSGTTNYFNDRIRAIAFYNTRPTNSELATLTQVDYTNLVWDTYTSRTSLSTELPECLFVRHIELLNT